MTFLNILNGPQIICPWYIHRFYYFKCSFESTIKSKVWIEGGVPGKMNCLPWCCPWTTCWILFLLGAVKKEETLRGPLIPAFGIASVDVEVHSWLVKTYRCWWWQNRTTYLDSFGRGGPMLAGTGLAQQVIGGLVSISSFTKDPRQKWTASSLQWRSNPTTIVN